MALPMLEGALVPSSDVTEHGKLATERIPLPNVTSRAWDTGHDTSNGFCADGVGMTARMFVWDGVRGRGREWSRGASREQVAVDAFDASWS